MVKEINKNFSIRKIKNGIVGKIRLTESYTSLIMGAIAVVVMGILFVSFVKINKNTQTSSTKDGPISQVSQDSNTSSTYTIKPGDDLWTISENVYNDGYKWIEIAKVNKLENPGLIYAGNKLVIPTVTPEKKIAINSTSSLKTEDKTIVNNSITGDSYTVVKGDNLWDIAVRAYGDGFKWPEIAKANNLMNPSLIHRGNIFKLPRPDPRSP